MTRLETLPTVRQLVSDRAWLLSIHSFICSLIPGPREHRAPEASLFPDSDAAGRGVVPLADTSSPAVRTGRAEKKGSEKDYRIMGCKSRPGGERARSGRQLSASGEPSWKEHSSEGLALLLQGSWGSEGPERRLRCPGLFYWYLQK